MHPVSETPAAGISDLIGLEAYREILSNLPDDYYDEPKETQARYWRKVRQAIGQNVQDVEQLAQLYKPS